MAFLALCISTSVRAYCVADGSDKYYLPGVSLKFQSVSSSTAMISKSWHQFNGEIYCRGGAGQYVRLYLESSYGEVASPYYVFEGKAYAVMATNASNVGVVFSVGIVGGEFLPFYQSGINFFNLSLSESVPSKQVSVIIRYRFVALGKILPGDYSVSMNANGRMLLRDYGSFSPNNVAWVYSSANKISVNNASCKLTVPASVSLRRTTMALIPSVGSTQDGATFKMSVSCPAAYASYKVLYAMTDVNTPANTSDRLSLAPIAGSAKGIALQLLDGDTPIKFAPESSLTAPTTSFGTMGTAGGSLVKQLTARYIRTAPAATPGLLKANASIVLSYD
jgi:type 1 fimbria pilin